MTQLYSGSQAAIALSAATARTVAAVVSPANRECVVAEIAISFDGVTASAVPVLVELCDFTVAGAGTRTTGTAVQMRGQRSTAGTSFFHSYTVEGTVLAAIFPWYVTPNGGLMDLQWPLGREPQTVVAKGLAIRCTAPAAVNCAVSIIWEE